MTTSDTSRTYRVRRKRVQDTLGAGTFHIGVIVMGFVMVYPLLWMLSSSFKGPSEIWTNISSLIPQDFTLQNYIDGWRGFAGISFATFFKNSLIVTSISTVASVFSSAVVAYGFARIKFVGQSFWFALMLATLMLPTQVQIIPQYIVFSRLGWINTYIPLILPHFFGAPFFIFMMVQFIRGIPIDLDEAAEIDGCSKIGIFFRIILPLIKPALITAAIFAFYWSWDDFLAPLIYLNDPNLYTISLALRSFADPSSVTNWGGVFAMGILALVPVFTLFVVFQRYLVEGINTTGLKG
ncbi:MAG: carbohydrate ABC transporter permease [Anaerolineae bacterium]